MTDTWTLVRDLFWPIAPGASARSTEGPPTPIDQSERALRLIGTGFVVGMIVLALVALNQHGIAAALRLFGIGALAALLAAALGGLLGLLFGLPTTVGRVPGTGTGTGTENNTGSNAGGATGSANTDWYRDNTALERISDWVTTAIVTLLIANFNRIWSLTGRVAIGITQAMGVSGSQSKESQAAVGGLLLGAYLLLGLLAGYLWSRRYLLKAFTDAVRDARLVQASSQQEVEKIVGKGNVMERPPGGDETRTAQAAVVDAAANPPAAPPAAAVGAEDKGAAESMSVTKPVVFPRPVNPGAVTDDPWHGVFGGQPRDARAVIAATVAPMRASRGVFKVDLSIATVDEAGRRALAGRQFRLYLHPTFPDPIRTVRLDSDGGFTLTLAAYGAFTVGVQFFDNARLELDLAKLPDAPVEFRRN